MDGQAMSDPLEGLEDKLESIVVIGAKLEMVTERGLTTDAIRRAEEAREEAQRAVELAEEGNLDEHGLFRDDAQGRKAAAAFDEALDRQRAAWGILEQALDAVLAEHRLQSEEEELALRREGIRRRLSLD
jgi:multidrug resistance efflux pump